MEEVVADAEIVSEDVGTDLEPVAQHEHANSLTLFNTNEPGEVLTQAARVADALKDVLRQQGLTQNIGGNDHVRVEGWQTVGSMLGVFPVREAVEELPWPEPVPEALSGVKAQGKSFGFKAVYRAQRTDGAIVGGGEGDCRRTEQKWKARDDFALKSMAQTRATSKALKAPLGFVVALAGYSATPAEEMGHTEEQRTYGVEASDKQAGTFVEALKYLNGHILSDVLPEPMKSTDLTRLFANQFGYLPSASTGAIILLAKHLRDVTSAPQEEEQ